MLYARGTSFERSADLTDLSRNFLGEPEMLAALFASQGYIVVAPNYAGYAGSDLGYHAYINAEQQSKDMIDALSAARSVLAKEGGAKDGGKLFITGYSEGGYVAMATHRAMQAAGMKVATSAPGSGPYALALFGDAVFQGQVNRSSTFFMPLLVTGYQKSYGDIYESPADFYDPKFAAEIETLLPSDISTSVLVQQGKLPGSALFDRSPPTAPAGAPPTLQAKLDAMSPAVTGTVADTWFAQGFGSPSLIRNTARLDYLQDSLAYPDTGKPDAHIAGTPNRKARNPLRRALQRNDLRNWTPMTPVTMCGGQFDPAVSFKYNTQPMVDMWASLPPSRVTFVDLDAPIMAGDNASFTRLKTAFHEARVSVMSSAVAAGATDGGAAAFSRVYHHNLVEPLCLVAAFDAFQAVMARAAS